jgi:amidase
MGRRFYGWLKRCWIQTHSPYRNNHDRSGFRICFGKPGQRSARYFKNLFNRLQQAGSPVSLIGLTALQPETWLPAFRIRQGFEAWATHGDFILRHQPTLGPGIAERFAFAQTITRDQYENSLAISQGLQERLGDLLEVDGILLLPTAPDISPLLSCKEDQLEAFRSQSLQLLALASLTGHPQITLPLLLKDVAPLGLSLIGPKGSDLSLARWAKQLFRELQD